MSEHLISESGLQAAGDAYEDGLPSYEQRNWQALERAIKAYLAADPVIVRALNNLSARDRIEQLAILDEEDRRSAEPDDRAYYQARATGLRMALGYLK